MQATAGVLAAVVMWILLSKQGKEYALLLSLGACALVMLVIDFSVQNNYNRAIFSPE